ncbi:MAG: aminoglycoside 3'-phosphotransferase [Xanthobacteraceae bacterium]
MPGTTEPYGQAMLSAAEHERLLSVLPTAWHPALSHGRIERVRSGMSAASVFRVGASHFLKIAQGPDAHDLRGEIDRTAWLGHQGVRVAPVVKVHAAGDLVAVLSEALAGSSADETDLPVEIVVPALARALSALHAIPVRDCPFDESVAVRLGRAGVLVESGLIDPGVFASRNRDVSPAALLERLRTRKPDEQVAVVHGDATLSNLIVGNDRSVAFIDCGHAGRADPYADIALVVEGLSERFGSAAVDGFMHAYGGNALNERKRDYFLDLYELF